LDLQADPWFTTVDQKSGHSGNGRPSAKTKSKVQVAARNAAQRTLSSHLVSREAVEATRIARKEVIGSPNLSIVVAKRTMDAAIRSGPRMPYRSIGWPSRTSPLAAMTPPTRKSNAA